MRNASQSQHLPNWEYSSSHFSYWKAQVNLIGWSKNVGMPQFPKDDKNISSHKTPKLIGARPCRYCGSGQHWNNECCHSRKGEKLAGVNFIWLEDDDIQAQENYDHLFYELDSNAEDSNQQDFIGPSSVLTFLTNQIAQTWINWRTCLAWQELKVLVDLWVQILHNHQILA